MKPRFELGSVVSFKGETETGVVLGFMWVWTVKKWKYWVSSSALDMGSKQVLEGLKIGFEDELILVKSKKT